MVFSSAAEFASYIEMRVLNEKKTHLELLTEMIEEEELDIETIQSLMSMPLRDRLEIDFQSLGYLPKSSNALTSFLD